MGRDEVISLAKDKQAQNLALKWAWIFFFFHSFLEAEFCCKSAVLIEVKPIQ